MQRSYKPNHNLTLFKVVKYSFPLRIGDISSNCEPAKVGSSHRSSSSELFHCSLTSHHTIEDASARIIFKVVKSQNLEN